MFEANPDEIYGTLPLPDAPTSALPGTLAKQKVMHERKRARVSLFHPFDATDAEPDRAWKFKLKTESEKKKEIAKALVNQADPFCFFFAGLIESKKRG